ncbi:MAG: GTPase HflX [Cytophagales bacterium]|nr:MAG: GTPase HflX [Cytophagales bacterium]
MGGYSTSLEQEKAILVALVSGKQSYEQTIEYLDELEFLALTMGVATVKQYIQRLERPDTRTFVGKGKLEEIKTHVIAEQINMVIFDDELSPSQVRNLENELKVPIYDRSLLILNIFLQRAKTAQARTQVELARYQYLLPRLTRMWSHLERQRGGTGTRGGAGEKEIETDRRVIKEKITLLKEQLKKIDKQNYTQRKSRGKVVRVALVGYTNVGKSTLMNVLTKSDIFAENKLFATVDSTVRKMVLNEIPFLISDTVGFIRKLPHTLVECFKSTLDEIRESDILLHVVDVSHQSFEEQIEIVNKTLVEIGAGDKTVIMVFNKSDKYLTQKSISEESDQELIGIDALKETYFYKHKSPAVFISATQKDNISDLRELLIKEVYDKHLLIFPNYL